MNEQNARKKIIKAAKEYCRNYLKKSPAIFPHSRINYAGRIFDEAEIANLIDASLDFWLTAGRYALKFEKEMAEFLGVKYCSFVNSGSSANLLAFMTLTMPELGERRIKRGDEVITTAVCFPTTVSPILQYGAVPVFVDVALPSYNMDCAKMAKALTSKTKAVMLAHTMGNPFKIAEVKRFCKKHNLWLIEDNCDALGSEYRYGGKWKKTGTFGDIGTSSFYPPHHITTGEGGAVYTNDPELARIAESLRDWGRDCWCPPGKDGTCNNRFSRKYGRLPYGYDHKYVYSRLGYNLKATDMQAAIGCAQLKKLPSFIKARRRNWKSLKAGLFGLKGKILLPEPENDSRPSWFGFLMTVQKDAGFTRADIVSHLESKGIQTRMLFAGNILKHPCFDELTVSGRGYRVAGSLACTDEILERTFWVGVYPGITDAAIRYIVKIIKDFVKAGEY